MGGDPGCLTQTPDLTNLLDTFFPLPLVVHLELQGGPPMWPPAFTKAGAYEQDGGGN